jgi:hypothetical protein
MLSGTTKSNCLSSTLIWPPLSGATGLVSLRLIASRRCRSLVAVLA